MTLSGVPVSLPPGAFLQATAERRDAHWPPMPPHGWAMRGWWPICLPGSAPFAFALRQGRKGARVEGRARGPSRLQKRRCIGRGQRVGAPTAICSAIRSSLPSSIASMPSCSIPRVPGPGRRWPRLPPVRSPAWSISAAPVKLGARMQRRWPRRAFRLTETAPRGPVPLVNPCRTGEPVRALGAQGREDLRISSHAACSGST